MNTNQNSKTTQIPSEIAAYEPYFDRILPTGSRIICSPPVLDTDEDYIVLIKPDESGEFRDRLLSDGWIPGGSLSKKYEQVGLLKIKVNDWSLKTENTYNKDGSVNEDNLFWSWKKDQYNLLVTCCEQYFDDFTRATFLAKELNLLRKEDRVVLFEALTRNVWPEPEEEIEKDRFIKNNDTFPHFYHTGSATIEVSLGQILDTINLVTLDNNF